MDKPLINQVSEFGNKVLSILIKYRVVTQGLLRQRFQMSESEIKQEIRNLRTKNLIAGFPFVSGERYYRLTRSACTHFGVSRRLSEKIGVQALKMNYGILHFCFTSSPPRRLLDADELKVVLFGQDVPKPDQKNPQGNFYLEKSSNHVRLGHVYVDCRSDARRLIKKVFSFIDKRRHIQEFRELVAQDRFVVSFVTESTGKAKAIQVAAERKGLKVCPVHICPQLHEF